MKKIMILAFMAVMAFSCEKDEPDTIVLTITEKTLNYGDEYQIDAESKSPIVYTVENEYFAKVTETGLVTARYVGETKITLTNAEGTKAFRIIIAPTINLYPEPKVEYGMTRTEVITKFGTPSSQTSTALYYENYSIKAPSLLFLFDTSFHLTSYSVLVKTAYTSDLATFLSERYFMVDIDERIFMDGLTTATATLIIKTELYNISYWMVIYVFSEELKKSANINNDNINIVELIKENLKNLSID